MLGAAMGFVSVAAGAFGAHGLRARVDADMLAVWEVAARYQMYHALAMILLGILMGRQDTSSAPHKALPLAGWFFLAGILIFSGSLYVMTLTGLKWLGAITPIGGISLLTGWVCLAIGVRKW